MGKKNAKHNSKKSKSKKSRAKNIESNLAKEQNQQKTSYDELSEIFLGTNSDSNIDNNISSNQQQGTNNNSDNILNSNTNTYENISQESETKAAENILESDKNKNTDKSTSADNSQCSDDIKARQQELLNNLKNLSDSITNLTLIRDNAESLRIEVLSNIYFTREVRPLIDAVNLISFASSNISSAAQNITINPFGEKKEIKNALKISYTMNDEIEVLLSTLTRRLKIYVEQLNNMDRNCPPFTFSEDS